MSDTLASLRRKIDGAAKLKSVVRTMKAVAASSIGQYEAAVSSLGDYERSVERGLSVCFREGTATAMNPSRGRGAIGAIVFGSDQGLVGQFNEVTASLVEEKLSVLSAEKKIWAVGERIYARLADAGLSPAGKFTVPSSVEGITSLVTDLQLASESKENGGCTEVYVFHARPLSGSLYEPVMQRLLPLDAKWQKDLAKIPWPTKTLPEAFGAWSVTLHAFVREYLFISLFKACAESLASENASRLAAMQRAEKNIEALVTNLNATFYRLRQNSIDEELFDVVAGFNSLSQEASRPKAKAAARTQIFSE
jgi:F-type H+-transporting ATPase subunit gamma